MPELPEVEVVKNGLGHILRAQPRILQFQFLRADLRDPMPTKAFAKLHGTRILEVSRRAKYLIFKTEQGRFLSHLGMTGTWRVEKNLAARAPAESHDHIRIFLENGDCLVYRDPRRFGVFDILNTQTEKKRFAHLGPEPLSIDFTGLSLWQSLRGKTSSVKVAIMDQKTVVGVGNIYASECLFLSGIKPQTKAYKITKSRADTLGAMIKKVLLEAIEAGGSTISDFENADGGSGYFQKRFKVYDRAGEECLICHTPIRIAVQAGRSTFWCPHCQS